MARIGRLFGLTILLGSLGPWGSPRALAQPDSSREARLERFLELLVRRQDQTLARLLARQKERLEARLERLEGLTPRDPQLARQIERLEQRLTQRVQRVDQKIVNPPATPIRRLIEQRAQELRRRAQLIDRRLDLLGRLTPRDPRRARQIERVMEIRERQLQRTLERVEFLDRLAATPFAPLRVPEVFPLEARGSLPLRWWRGPARGRS